MWCQILGHYFYIYICWIQNNHCYTLPFKSSGLVRFLNIIYIYFIIFILKSLMLTKATCIWSDIQFNIKYKKSKKNNNSKDLFLFEYI